MISLYTSIEEAPRINRRILPALKHLGVKTLRDLLFHFPARYEDFSNQKSIRDAKLNETVTVQGAIKRVTNRRTAKKRMVLTEAVITDETGGIKALWFHQPFITRNLRAGNIVSLSGKVVLGPDGVYLQNPAYEKLSRLNLDSDYRGLTSIHTKGLISIYPETKGISSRWLRYLIKTFMELRKELRDPFPTTTLRKYHFPEVRDAIRMIHFPESLEEAERAKKRFTFEELLLIQLRALRERAKLKNHSAPEIAFEVSLVKKFVASLSFELTDAQRRSMWEIFQDIAKPRPMNRLLEGDVGSGKTVVAAAAALLTVKSGNRAVVMAPTEILARQHYDTLIKLLKPFDLKIGLLIGAEKKAIDAPVIVGTHALIQDNVPLENLGLVIVDEQHRFGVEQRAKLVTSNQLPVTQKMLPHFLSMSATPIPRTLALTVYGDLDLSILDEMPKARKPVITRVVEPGKREKAYQFIRDEVGRGRQVFVICPRIEKPMDILRSNLDGKEVRPQDTATDTKAVKEEYKKLSEGVFKDLKVGMLHGKLKSKEKDAVMRKFKDRGLDVLVSTSVVEVGVDIPNATVMMIEGAERFGLATLHQFRGRVGRGAEQSYCLLLPTEDSLISKRLRALVETRNGFELAERDLEIRGAGDIFGTRQWGVSSEVMKALTDAKLVRAVRQEAIDLLKTDPALVKAPLLRERLEVMEREVHLE